jgi:predicted transcriptional regulator
MSLSERDYWPTCFGFRALVVSFMQSLLESGWLSSRQSLWVRAGRPVSVYRRHKRFFLLLDLVHVYYEIHAAVHPMDIIAVSPRVKRLEREVGHTSPC